MGNWRRTAGGLSVVVVLAGLVGAVQAAAPAPGQISALAGTIGEGPATGIAQRPRSLTARGNKVYVGSESLHVVRELDTGTGASG